MERHELRNYLRADLYRYSGAKATCYFLKALSPSLPAFRYTYILRQASVFPKSSIRGFFYRVLLRRYSYKYGYNESAKMKTSHGVIQGYNGVAVVDDKTQVIVHAEAFGAAQEHDLLEPMIEGVKENFKEIGHKQDVLKKAKLVADSGYHTEANMKMVMEDGIDAYIAVTQFRKRDPRFADVDKYKERFRKERDEYYGKKGLYRPKDFVMSADKSYCICPAGKRMYRSDGHVTIKKNWAIKFCGRLTDCRVCELREQCLRCPATTEARQVYFFQGRSDAVPETFSEKMRRKIDSIKGRLIYNRRLGTAEPPFAHIRSILRLDRFILRRKRKVNTQWLMYCIVHNLLKVHRYGEGFA